MSVCQEDSHQFFTKMAHKILLKFYMKIERFKEQNLTELNFSENSFLKTQKELRISVLLMIAQKLYTWENFGLSVMK